MTCFHLSNFGGDKSNSDCVGFLNHHGELKGGAGHKEELKRKTLLLCDSLAGPSWASVQVNGPWVSLRAQFWAQGGAEDISITRGR